jgi:hypothetical protein
MTHLGREFFGYPVFKKTKLFKDGAEGIHSFTIFFIF